MGNERPSKEEPASSSCFKDSGRKQMGEARKKDAKQKALMMAECKELLCFTVQHMLSSVISSAH